MRKTKIFLALTIFIILGTSIYSALFNYSDEEIVTSLEALLPKLESTGLTAYRNQDWCQVIAYDGKAFSNTDKSTCVFVIDLATQPFSLEAGAKLKEIADILSQAKVSIRSVENIQLANGKIDYIEFHEDCSCRTRYVFKPNYGQLPADIPNDLWHFAINQNWYRVEEDWN